MNKNIIDLSERTIKKEAETIVMSSFLEAIEDITQEINVAVCTLNKFGVNTLSKVQRTCEDILKLEEPGEDAIKIKLHFIIALCRAHSKSLLGIAEMIGKYLPPLDDTEKKTIHKLMTSDTHYTEKREPIIDQYIKEFFDQWEEEEKESQSEEPQLIVPYSDTLTR